MKYIKKLSTIIQTDNALCGGKACGLSALIALDINVPDGFLITTDAFAETLEKASVLEKIDKEINRIEIEDADSVRKASINIQNTIQHAAIPEHIENEIKTNFSWLGAKNVAVRSSATAEDGHTAAWAGQLDSFLYVNESTLLNKIRSCWASLFSERALAYRVSNEIVGSVQVAVIVQEIVPSDVSGIAFSIDPVSNNSERIVIEAGWGMGEAVVSGQITPDLYVVEKSTNAISEVNVSSQERMLQKEEVSNEKTREEWFLVPAEKQRAQKLSHTQIQELAAVVKKIERHFGFPCDVEWALASGILYILQSRPITTTQSLY